MEDLNVPIFAQAKLEYTNQLIDVLYPHMYDGVKSIYDESKVIHTKKTGTPILFLFRELLEKVPIWNSEIIESECSRIMNNSKCDWIEDLITAVFISHTKILTSIGPSNTFNKINVTIPKTTSFIHKAYVNLARELWKNPYLFNENVPGHEYQRNSKEIENIIKQCVEGTVRQLLPIKEILREHLDTYDSDNTPRSRDDIKLLLKEELQELKNQIFNSDYRNIDKEDKGDKEDNEDSGDRETETESIRVTKEDPEEMETKSFQITKEDPEEMETKSFQVTKEDTEGTEEDPGMSPKEQIKDLVISDLPDESSVENHTIESEPLNLYISESNDDPSDEQIKKQVSDIVVNDITIPVSEEQVEGSIEGFKEITYDNADIMEYKEVNDEDKVKKMLTNLEPININVIKNDNINDTGPGPGPEPESEPQLSGLPISDNSSFKLDNIFGFGQTKVVEPKIEAIEPNIETIESKIETIEPKSKEIITIDSNDIDETSSLANFFNDMKQVVEDKGIKVESSNNFTLFEDASESG